MNTEGTPARFAIGELIHHRLFGYRGVVYDIDPVFSGSEEWYEHVARSRPPKDKPWYKVFVHDGQHETYVAERNLEKDPSQEPINHPGVEYLFERFENGMYLPRRRVQ